MASPPRTAVTIICFLAVGGCKAFDETLLETDAGPSCPLTRPPDRPDGPDGDDGTTYFWAVRDMVIDQRENRWSTIGYDLDGLCSYEPDPIVECRAPATSAPPETDGEGGIDNVLGQRIIPLILIAYPNLPMELRDIQTANGVGVFLIQVRGWNGERNDSQVEAVLSISSFGTSRRPDRVDSWELTPAGGLIVNGEDWPTPQWDGNDWWYARDENFLAGDPEQPRTRDTNAYIVGGTLVFRVLDRFPIIFGGDVRATQFLLTDTVITARISDDKTAIEGASLAGRFGVLDFLDTIPSVGACPGSDDYLAIERLLELAADVRSVPESGGPGAECDAVSVGLAFDRGSRANFGGVVDGIVIDPECGPMPDGGMPDGGTRDAGTDAGGMEAGVDAGAPDAGFDAGFDSGP